MKIYNSSTNYIYKHDIAGLLVNLLKQEYYENKHEEEFYTEEDDLEGLDIPGLLSDITDSLNRLQCDDITPPFIDQDSGYTVILDKKNRMKYEACLMQDPTTNKHFISLIVSTMDAVLVNNNELVMGKTEFDLSSRIYGERCYDCRSKFDID